MNVEWPRRQQVKMVTKEAKCQPGRHPPVAHETVVGSAEPAMAVPARTTIEYAARRIRQNCDAWRETPPPPQTDRRERRRLEEHRWEPVELVQRSQSAIVAARQKTN